MEHEGTYRGADLAVLRGHAVSVVQVCKGLGRPPGLQVPGHAHRGPHLGPIKGVTSSEEVLGTPSFTLGVGKLIITLGLGKLYSLSFLLHPIKKCPLIKHLPLTSPLHLYGFCPHSFSATDMQCYKLFVLSHFRPPGRKLPVI